MQVGERVEDVTLTDAWGEAVPLSHLLDRLLVVQLLRYYG